MSGNGKGSTQRQQTKEERKRFEANYARIFRPKRKKAVATRVETEGIPKRCQKLTKQLLTALRRRLKDRT